MSVGFIFKELISFTVIVLFHSLPVKYLEMPAISSLGKTLYMSNPPFLKMATKKVCANQKLACHSTFTIANSLILLSTFLWSPPRTYLCECQCWVSSLEMRWDVMQYCNCRDWRDYFNCELYLPPFFCKRTNRRRAVSSLPLEILEILEGRRKTRN